MREERQRRARSRPVHASMAFTGDGVFLGAGAVLAKARAQGKVSTCNFLVKQTGAVALHLGIGTVLPHVKDVFRVDDVALLVPGQAADYRLRSHRMQRLREI